MFVHSEPGSLSARYSRLSYYPSIFSVECPLQSERKHCLRRCRCCCCCRCLEAASIHCSHAHTYAHLETCFTHMYSTPVESSLRVDVDVNDDDDAAAAQLPRVARQTSSKVSLTCRHNRFLMSASLADANGDDGSDGSVPCRCFRRRRRRTTQRAFNTSQNDASVLRLNTFDGSIHPDFSNIDVIVDNDNDNDGAANGLRSTTCCQEKTS